jgi:hypothetical protein
MKTVSRLRTAFLVIAVSFLMLPIFVEGAHIGDKLAVQSINAYTNKDIPDPDNPWPIQKFFLIWAFRFGSGYALCQTVILLKRWRKEVTSTDQEMEARFPLPHPMDRWRV